MIASMAESDGKVGILKATDLINVAWPILAARAYGRFLARGRGGVLIPVAAIKLRPDGQGIIDVDGRYVTAEDITSNKVSIPTDTIKEFEAYDPEREVVFLFDDGTGIATYRGAPSGQPSPKDLYEQAQQASS